MRERPTRARFMAPAGIVRYGYPGVEQKGYRVRVASRVLGGRGAVMNMVYQNYDGLKSAMM